LQVGVQRDDERPFASANPASTAMCCPKFDVKTTTRVTSGRAS
jgi:hypothetical protein